MTADFPPVGEQPWELRFTRRALADLGATDASDTPGDLPAVRRAAAYPRVVDDFAQKRAERPDAPGDTLHSMGRGDIISLHSAAGARAATWHGPDNGVVWCVGFTPNHDYTLLEARAAAGELLPDEDDELQLELEREERDFEARIRPGLHAYSAALQSRPNSPSAAPWAGSCDWRSPRLSCPLRISCCATSG